MTNRIFIIDKTVLYGKKRGMMVKEEKQWVFWLAIILSVVGVIAIVMMALRILGVV